MTTPIERGAEAIREGGAQGSDAEFQCDARAVFESIDVDELAQVESQHIEWTFLHPGVRCQCGETFPDGDDWIEHRATAIKAHLLDGGDDRG